MDKLKHLLDYDNHIDFNIKPIESTKCSFFPSEAWILFMARHEIDKMIPRLEDMSAKPSRDKLN